MLGRFCLPKPTARQISDSQMLLREAVTLTAPRYYSCAADVLDLPRTLLHLLQISTSHHSLHFAKQTHARVFSLGVTQNPFLVTKLVSVYASFGCLIDSQLVFDSIQDKNVFVWNSMINGYAKNHANVEALGLFKKMCNGNVLPDDFTLATISKIAGELGELNSGKLVHGKSIRVGFVCDTIVANSLMSMYGKCGEFCETRKMFDEMQQRNVGSWNALTMAYINSEDCCCDEYFWGVVRRMQVDGVKLDRFTISILLPLCGGKHSRKWDYGRELHCYAMKNLMDVGPDSDLHFGCCLIDMYSKSNKLVVGKKIFDRIKYKNVYAWTAMINGFVESGNLDEALALFREMQNVDCMGPNKVSLVSILPACTSLAGLMSGKQVHGYAFRKGLNKDVSLCNALIDMYSKCGSLNYARRIFDDVAFSRDAISWSSMISGYGLHGEGREAVLLYDRMLQMGNKPDMITVVGVLSACSRSGLVNEGLNIYNKIINHYGIKPTVEICACVVDMLGRSGQLDRALEFIKTMPVEPSPSVWGALVSASATHGNLEMQDLAYRFIIKLEPENPSNYVSLSNLHASSNRWNAAAQLRRMMKEKGLKKAPGCSWISISGQTHCFYVADKVHPHSNSIYRMMDALISVMKEAGDPTDIEDLAWTASR